jgi:hypothetical protein
MLNDAKHIAYASVYKMDYLLTWNQKHIVNHQKLLQINQIINDFGLKTPCLCTPAYFLELRNKK